MLYSSTPLISTPYEVIDVLMEIINVGSHDIFYDLGCGDGRIVIEAAKRGAYGVCIELNSVLCNVVQIASRLANVVDRVKVICDDMFKINLSSVDPQPTVIYLYHYLSVVELIAYKLEKELKPGTLVVSLDTPIRRWSPLALIPIVDSNNRVWFLWFYIVN